MTTSIWIKSYYVWVVSFGYFVMTERKAVIENMSSQVPISWGDNFGLSCDNFGLSYPSFFFNLSQVWVQVWVKFIPGLGSSLGYLTPGGHWSAVIEEKLT